MSLAGVPYSRGSVRPLVIECRHDEQDDKWDEFVESVAGGHHEQTSLWGQVRAQYGWHIWRIVALEDGCIVGGAQVQTRRLGRFGTVAYVTYGPCISRQDPVLERAVVGALKDYARRLGWDFLAVGLPYNGHHWVPDLTAAGFLQKPPRFPPNFMAATSVIDLTPNPGQLLSNMRRTTRHNIHKGLRRGIAVVEQDGQGLAGFYNLMAALCQRRKTAPNPPDAEFFVHLWRRFRPKGWIRLFFAMNGSEPVSAAVSFTFQDWFRVWKIGWSGQHGHSRPNETLWWQMILCARREGFRFFDFVEIDADEAKRRIDGEADENALQNVTSFKLGFGGDIRLLPGAYYYVLNPALQVLFRCGLGRCLDSAAFLKFAHRFLRRASRN